MSIHKLVPCAVFLILSLPGPGLWSAETNTGSAATPAPTPSGNAVHTAGSADSVSAALAAETLIDRLAAGNFAGAGERFDSRMKTAVPEARLQATWETLNKQAGPFKGRLGTRVESQSEVTVAFVTCEFERGILDAKMTSNPAGEITGLFFVPGRKPATKTSQADAPGAEVTETARTIGTDEWALPATLSRPARGQDASLPAIVLVHGSGPHDRDETVGANKPFRDLAWGLAAKGVAVLRYEKRTKAHAARMAALPDLTIKEEVVDDALAAVALLRTTDGVDRSRIFVLGHSLGGMLAPRIARLDTGIAGLVILAGPTRPMEDIILDQSRYLAALDGSVSTDEQMRLDRLQSALDRVKQLTPADAGSSAPVLGLPAAYWLDLRTCDGPSESRKLPQPMLILQGGRDYQVTATDFAGWEKELGGNERVTLRLYPNLNHLFIAGEGRGTPAEYAQAGHVAQEVIDDIATWIRES